MSNVEWFRRSTWTDVDREEFNARLRRSRGLGNKAQYLRIQAFHLAESGHHHGALELLDRLFAEFPDRIQLAQAHVQKAELLAILGDTDAVVGELRAALKIEREFPNVRTQAWLGFGWFVCEKQLRSFYNEAAAVLQEFGDERGYRLPAEEYRYCTIQALLAEARGEKTLACQFAKLALAEAAKAHSGLRYHAKIGLVGNERNTFENRLRELAAS